MVGGGGGGAGGVPNLGLFGLSRIFVNKKMEALV